MDLVVIGTDARWFIDDVEMLWGAGSGEPILIGIDLAPGPELGPPPAEKLQREVQRDVLKLPDGKLSHPTTARELRRAERRRNMQGRGERRG